MLSCECLCECLQVIEWVCKNLLALDVDVCAFFIYTVFLHKSECVWMCACMRVYFPIFGQKRWSLFITLFQRCCLWKGEFWGAPPPLLNEQIWSCHRKNSCIHWMTLIFSHFTQVQWTKQAGESWGRHFLRLRLQWQTCSNYLKSK